MRVAIINNGKVEPKNLLRLLKNEEVSVFTPSDAPMVATGEFDLIVLSGSSHLAAMYDNKVLAPELDLIRRSKTPIVGVCFGCELLVRAFGGTLKKTLSDAVRDLVVVKVTREDPLFCGRSEFEVYDAHRWVVDNLPSEFDILAESSHGPEIIKHHELPFLGLQFHPEKMIDESYGDELFWRFLDLEVRDHA